MSGNGDTKPLFLQCGIFLHLICGYVVIDCERKLASAGSFPIVDFAFVLAVNDLANCDRVKALVR